MAVTGSKISQLDPAGTLAGTEEIPIVKNGSTVKTTPNAIVAAEASARALGDTAQSFAAVVLTNPFTAGKAPRRIGDFAVNTTSGEIWQSTAITNAAASWNCISAGYYNGRIITNWDTHTQSGDITSYGIATGTPTSTESFYGHHINSNAGTVNAVQWAIGYTTLKMYFRAKTASTWGAWSTGITATELGYLSGATSNIQSQIDAKANQTDLDQLEGEVSVKMTNAVVNGDFRDGLDGWELTPPGSITVDQIEGENVVHINHIGSSPSYMCQNITGTIGDKVYLSYHIKVISIGASGQYINTGLYFNGAFYIGNNPKNEWVKLTRLQTLTVDDPRLTFGNTNYNDDYEAFGKNIMAINLTQAFGAGNEPTKEEVELLLDILGTDYFEGEITIPAQKIMQWQLKLIRKNKNAIITLGGTII